MDTEAIEQIFQDSFVDEQMSRSERKAIRAVLEESCASENDRRCCRNMAFDFMQKQLSAHDSMLCFRWLRETVRLIDQTREQNVEQRAYFSPGEACRDAIVDVLCKSRTSVDICVFTITDDRITRHIVDAIERGVQVRIISDNEKVEDRGNDVRFLQEQGAVVCTDATRHHMHHKFAVIDGRVLINGSFNWTRSASDYNQENIVISNATSLIQQFQNEFDRLWIKLS